MSHGELGDRTGRAAADFPGTWAPTSKARIYGSSWNTAPAGPAQI